MFLFLNSLENCEIDGDPQVQGSFKVRRFNDRGNSHVAITSNFGSDEWMLTRNEDVSAAFLIRDGIIVPCDNRDAVMHCYLPTLDKSIIACKLNADFSTDPSRKHITFDDKTKLALEKIASLIVQDIRQAIEHAATGKFKNLLDMFSRKSTISKSNRYLDELIEEGLTSSKWMKLNNGSTVSPVDYPVFPNAFTLDRPDDFRKTRGQIADNSLPRETYENIDGVDEFFRTYSRQEVALDMVINDMQKPEFINSLNDESAIQLTTNVIRESRIKSRLNPSYISRAGDILIKSNKNSLIPAKELTHSDAKLDNKIEHELEERLGKSEMDWFERETGLASAATSPESSTACDSPIEQQSSSHTVIAPHISKWRDAEAKCIEIEEALGNEAIDVSVKNLGYDVLSTTPSGEKRYIEVKSVKKDFSFSLTNNEYTAAHEFGDSYYVCLLCENENKLEVRIIQNPLKSARFEKRIRQWEWTCLEFNSTAMSFDF